MKTELANYEISPKMLPVDRESEIIIRPLGAHAAFEDGVLYVVQVLPMTGGEPQSYRERAAGGLLRFRHFFAGEQEHSVRVFADSDETERIVSLAVYSLLPDLFERRPYKGDFHAHSCRSDGKEAPAVMVANYRKAGFDFMAVTDHGQWDPSDEAVQAWAGQPVDIRVFHGEEVHSPGNHIHIVNFGGSFSVNELALNDPALYEVEVEAIRRDVGVLPARVNGFEYAACIWSSQKIREGGGMGIFCHPHWIANAYHVPDAMSWHILRTMPLDAFELFGGQTVPENNMQLAMYNEARAQGCQIPIVASSDSHGTVNAHWFNWVSTVVFAKSLELADIIEAVKLGYSAAQEHYPGEHPRAHGAYRMASYAMFLLREYWPLHDELCIEEGRAMKAFLCGDTDERKILELAQGRTTRLLERCFGDQGNQGRRMDRTVRIGIIGDYDGRASHLATDSALHHAAKRMGLQLEIQWLNTQQLEGQGAEIIRSCDGVWCAPGSPYQSMQGALDAIRQAREHDIPFIGTCGGFQHAVIEFARNVLGVGNAAHAEVEPTGSSLFITPLACSLAGQSQPIQIRRGTLSYRCYGCRSSTESFLCSFGLNPNHQKLLEVHGLQTAAIDENGEARILELAGNRYFVATLFVPQLTSTEDHPHPLVLAFISAAAGKD